MIRKILVVSGVLLILTIQSYINLYILKEIGTCSVLAIAFIFIYALYDKLIIKRFWNYKPKAKKHESKIKNNSRTDNSASFTDDSDELLGANIIIHTIVSIVIFILTLS